MSNLRQIIESHAQQFAAAIVQALRSASLDELVAITGGAGRGASAGTSPKARKGKDGRLGRRSQEDIEATLKKIVSVLVKHPEGLRSEQIKAALQLDTREMPRPIAEGLSSGILNKSGNKRATVYTAKKKAAKKKAG
ncbi:MAG: hypothetical protein KF764_34370 [Labilithrix sp.]|nr:hypothetical protein [Labilithrix sp.]